MIIYSAVDEESFRDLQDYWFLELQHYLRLDDQNVPILLVANKSDLISPSTDTVNFATTKELSVQKGLLPPIQCSAKTGHDVKRAFHIIATELFKRNQILRKPKVSSVSSRQECSCVKSRSNLSQESIRVDHD